MNSSPRNFRFGAWIVGLRAIGSRIRSCGRTAVMVLATAAALAVVHSPAGARSLSFDRTDVSDDDYFFALSPDYTIRRIDPAASDKVWRLAKGTGVPPFYFHTELPGLYDRIDFLYPLGLAEESPIQSKLAFRPLFYHRWSKVPPFDGESRWLTFYHGRSDLGQEYWGAFPFYGYSYRRFGADENFFFLFPLYYRSRDDDAVTNRILWPIITYADSPGRSALKVYPIAGRDRVRNDYYHWFFLWPFFQHTTRYPGTEQEDSWTALAFPVFQKFETPYSRSYKFFWPLISYYEHFEGHKVFRFRPFFAYGTGGGVEEINIMYLYSKRTEVNDGGETSGADGYVSVLGDEVFTERKFLMMSSIQKRYRQGRLVFSRYRFWPFAEYTWDVESGSRLKVPEIIPVKADFWDVNLGRYLRFIDFRQTPITDELSLLFGLSRRTEIKDHPRIPSPPEPGDDDWTELISGSFGKR